MSAESRSNNSYHTKRVAAIHDISGFGRCALTVVIPIISAMGIQTVPMPTAVLSTHTGGFSDFSFLDLGEQMKEFFAHWKQLGLTFDAIYSGFLGSSAQFDTVYEFIKYFKRDGTTVLVDPVLGDNGEAYATITPEMIDRMRSLITEADVITPNVTEAHFLLDMPYGERSESEVLEMAAMLSKLGPKHIVITGWEDSASSSVGSICYSAEHGTPTCHRCKTVNASYPGTGDVFASVLLGKLMSGNDLDTATEFASHFVCSLIADTAKAGTPPREGVLIERSLGKLM